MELAPSHIPAVLLYNFSSQGIIFWIENGASSPSSLSRNIATVSENILSFKVSDYRIIRLKAYLCMLI